MKLQFKRQYFQTEAVNSVVNLFKGQEESYQTFSMIQEAQMNFLDNGGIGNKLTIDDYIMLKNMHEIQKRNNLLLSSNIKDKKFCIEAVNKF